MIYISSSCIKKNNILDIIDLLVSKGIKNIELSGGSKNFDNLEKKLIEYKKKYKLNLRIHNYFPPPKEDFVVNIASLNSEIYEKSISHCLNAIKLSKKLEADRYSIHGGFLIDPGVKEIGIGNSLKKKELYDANLAIQKMISAIKLFHEEAGNDLKIYIENNVISKKNYEKYQNNPFILTTRNDYENLSKKINFNLLLDVAHLKVSSNALGENFKADLEFLFEKTDYVHLSSNDSLEDSNNNILSDTELVEFLKSKDLKKKTLTLEVYEDLNKVIEDYNFLNKI